MSEPLEHLQRQRGEDRVVAKEPEAVLFDRGTDLEGTQGDFKRPRVGAANEYVVSTRLEIE